MNEHLRLVCFVGQRSQWSVVQGTTWTSGSLPPSTAADRTALARPGRIGTARGGSSCLESRAGSASAATPHFAVWGSSPIRRGDSTAAPSSPWWTDTPTPFDAGAHNKKGTSRLQCYEEILHRCTVALETSKSMIISTAVIVPAFDVSVVELAVSWFCHTRRPWDKTLNLSLIQ